MERGREEKKLLRGDNEVEPQRADKKAFFLSLFIIFMVQNSMVLMYELTSTREVFTQSLKRISAGFVRRGRNRLNYLLRF